MAPASGDEFESAGNRDGVGSNLLKLEVDDEVGPSGATSPLPNPSNGTDGGDCVNHPMSLLPTLREVLAFQISSWYPTFASRSIGGRNHAGDDGDPSSTAMSSSSTSTPVLRKNKRRSRVTIRTVLLDLPTEFVDAYLTSQGTVRLPPGAVTSSILRTGRPAERDDDSDNSDDWSSDSSTPTGDNLNRQTEPPLPLFTELDDAIRAAIQELGGAVVPKLNWSAPKDASWMNAGSLKCQTPGDIYLLLQSSDFVSYDIHHALAEVRRNEGANEEDGGDAAPATANGFSGYQLALRKWCTLHPSQEFRCFVKGRQLIAISQRHYTSHYPHLVRNQDDIRSALQDFHDTYVSHTFAVDAHGVPVVSHYVMDAYIDQHGKVWILDFNVWGRRTDPLLFTWEELNDMSATTIGAVAPESNEPTDVDEAQEEAAAAASAATWPVLRVVETSKQVRHDPLASYRAPIDAVHVAGLGGKGLVDGQLFDHEGPGPSAFDECAKLCRRPSPIDVGDSSEDDSSDDDSDDNVS